VEEPKKDRKVKSRSWQQTSGRSDSTLLRFLVKYQKAMEVESVD
jgi:hypothetical protein